MNETMNDVEITYRPDARARFPLMSEMFVEPGAHEDWLLLNSLHYKADSLPVGASHRKLTFRGETIGVCVFGMSRPLLKERHLLFPSIKPSGGDTQISNIHRYAVINDEFRVISRFVIDTMFRSAGLAYRFANLAARQHGFRYIEIQSSMSKYNLFAQRAGFGMTKPMRATYYEAGLKFMRRLFDAHPADLETLMIEFNGMSQAMQKKVAKELKRFYFDHSSLEKTGSRRFYSGGVVEGWDVRRTLSKIQGLCFASPLYGLYRNPDVGRVIPSRLPLLAFELQPTTAPLDLAALERM